jgi:hypothetical protein
MAELERPKPAGKKRTNAAEPIKATGVKPRAAGERSECDICALPYGTEALVRNPVAGGSKFVHSSCLAAVDAPLDEAPAPELGGRGGTADVRRTPTPPPDAEPAPASLRIVDRKPTPAQRAMLFALAAEVFDVDEKLSPSEQDKVRQALLFDLAADLGVSGLTSRKEIDFALASKMIDAFGAIKDGRAAIIDGTLVGVDEDGVIGGAP